MISFLVPLRLVVRACPYSSLCVWVLFVFFVLLLIKLIHLKKKNGTSFRLFGHELPWQVSFVNNNNNNKNKNKAY